MEINKSTLQLLLRLLDPFDKDDPTAQKQSKFSHIILKLFIWNLKSISFFKPKCFDSVLGLSTLFVL